jgi:UDP-N-acetylmuramyl tripeptide synthase
MTEDDLRAEGAIEYAQDIMEGLEELSYVLNRRESATIKKAISAVEIMVMLDFGIPENRKLDS